MQGSDHLRRKHDVSAKDRRTECDWGEGVWVREEVSE